MLRGLCAIAIAGYHYVYWVYRYDLQSLAMFGVYIFFVLSALVLTIRYSVVFQEGISPMAAAQFYRNRLARILPLLMLMATVAYIDLPRRDALLSFTKAFLTGTGLFSLQLPGALSNTPGAWSLGIELAFYCVFPMVCLLCSCARLRTLCLILVVLLFAQQLAISILPKPDDPSFWGRYSMPLTFSPFFLAGIIIYRLGHREWRYGWTASILLFIFICAFSLLFRDNLFLGGAPYIFLSIVSVLAVAFAYNTDFPSKLEPLAAMLGNLSYSIYLSHWFVFQKIDNIDSPVLRLIAFCSGTILLSMALHRWFETPLRNRIRTIGTARASCRPVEMMADKNSATPKKNTEMC
jgi:peptidoglycan/LPS O-acetylase OafA/YrhL